MRRWVILSVLITAACDGGRSVPAPGPGPSGARHDASATNDGSAVMMSDARAGLDAALGGNLDAAPSRDAGPQPDAGPCTVGPVQPRSQPCCLSLGVDACEPRSFCAAFDGRTIPICYVDGSRMVGETCNADSNCASPPCSAGRCSSRFSTSAEILAFLEGVTLLQEGGNIPTHPQGIDEDLNLGASTQCYSGVEIQVRSGQVHQHIALGTLEGNPPSGAAGNCNHAIASSQIDVSSTSFSIQNVTGNGACFDVAVTFSGYSLEGRGSIEPDGSMVRLEVYFGGTATGFRCADGSVGAGRTVTVRNMPFNGDAVQRFEVR